MAGNGPLFSDTGIDISLKPKQVRIPSAAEYDQILADMVRAFLGKRKGFETQRDTEDKCRDILEQCITGYKKNNEPWKKVPNKSNNWYDLLESRLKVFGYYLHDKELRPKREGRREKVDKVAEEIQEKAKEFDDALPPAGRLTPVEKDEMEKFINDIKITHPTLKSPADEVLIARLAYLSIRAKRDIDKAQLTPKITDEMNKLVEMLGISGKQRMVSQEKESHGTLDVLSARFEKTKREHPQILTVWLIEEVELLLQSSVDEFLAQAWLRETFGSTINGEPLTLQNAKKWLDENKEKLMNKDGNGKG